MQASHADGSHAPVRRTGWTLLCLLGLLFLTRSASAESALPPAPKNYVNDLAGVMKPVTVAQLEKNLADYERQTSVQIVVAVFPKLPEGEALEDYTVRTAQAWGVGQKTKTGKNNGAVLFVFVADRKMRIEVGYGLEGAIPDAIAKRITSDQIKPHFQRGDYNSGISAGVSALMQAARGEYQGTGRTVNDLRSKRVPWPLIIIVGFFILMGLSSFRRRGRGTSFNRNGRSGGGFWPVFIGGGDSGGGWSGGGGGGFSGGGGDFGGGGASDSW